VCRIRRIDTARQFLWISLPGPGRTPSWSPDGAWLTFSQNLAGGDSAILMGQLNGGQRVIVPSGGRNPVWIRR
jgi:Tol biopolymer transport system component